jgi:type II secretory pathway pseudopilin PulG
MHMFNRKKNGFTLIELLVIFSIIGVLSSIAVVVYRENRADARDSKRILELSQMQAALEDFYDEYDAYPCGDFCPRPSNGGCPLPFSVDSSSSFPFLDGEDGLTENAGCCFTHPDCSPAGDGYPRVQGLCIDDSAKHTCYEEGDCTPYGGGLCSSTAGLYTNGYWPEEFLQDPINDSSTNYRYWYVTNIQGRNEYHLSAKLENNDELMLNDGGACDNYYEVFTDGIFDQGRNIDQYVVGGCN